MNQISIPETTETPSIEEQLKTQHGLYAFSSMVITNLPFPPLPVVVLHGNGKEGMASSFDLFSQAIIAMQFADSHATMSTSQLIDKKKETLNQLLSDIHTQTQSFSTNLKKDEETLWLDKIYTTYCSAFREYLISYYPTCTKDLRFFPMDFVDSSHVIIQQARSHIAANTSLTQNGDHQTQPEINEYSDVIRLYALDVHSLK